MQIRSRDLSKPKKKFVKWEHFSDFLKLWRQFHDLGLVDTLFLSLKAKVVKQSLQVGVSTAKETHLLSECNAGNSKVRVFFSLNEQAGPSSPKPLYLK